ncbi:hypothetical protein [Bdellovibrio sp. HCB-110]|uniref:hypothetical protein n=1 Tax=Bdellovibrio sp. HCB-110 TaxID=3391182 RepID=UPI0039B4F128
MSKYFLVFLALLTTHACSHKNSDSHSAARSTASLNELLSESVFQTTNLQWLRNLDSQYQAAALSPTNCAQNMKNLVESVARFNPALLQKSWIESYGSIAIKDLANFRFTANTQISQVPVSCRVYAGDLFGRLRDIEDYVGETYYKIHPLQGDKVDFKKQAVPLLETTKYNPYHLNPKYKDFQFQPGDIMITRGISFMSAAIAQSTTLPSKFSHGVFVYDDGSGKIQTIESYIQTGVEFFSIEDALKNENARIMVFRAKDPSLAQKANDMMGEEIKSRRDKKTGSLTYDYDANIEDHSRLTCIEIPYAAFELASKDSVKMPQAPSEMMLKKKDITQGLKVKPGPIFSPFNLETDDRFELVVDWTDYRLSQDQRNKDLLVRKMFDLIENEDYVIQENMNSIAARAIWKSRSIKPLWSLLGGFGNLNKLPAEMPLQQITITAKLYKSAGIFLQALRDWQAKTPGKIYTNQEIRRWLDEYVARDRENYIQRRRADLHIYFRPFSLRQQHFGEGA